MPDPFVIAIDGPAASGKGTLSRRLASEFGLRHLDTGLTYRAVGKQLLDEGAVLDNEALAVAAANQVDLSALNRDQLAVHEIAEAASKIAAMPAVRTVLVDLQRAFAATPPGAVLDGRDIGTVVCPQADVKLYVTASPYERAMRRFREVKAYGNAITFEELLADITARDERDMNRANSPLRPANDAHVLDTSEMTIDEAFLAAVRVVKAR